MLPEFQLPCRVALALKIALVLIKLDPCLWFFASVASGRVRCVASFHTKEED